MNEGHTIVVDPTVTGEQCRKCGACCLYEVYESCTDDGTCLNFAGKVGLHCRCACYRQRPPECREYLPGSVRCLQSRACMLRDAKPRVVNEAFARTYAGAAHGQQKYGDKPYLVHLEDVAALVLPCDATRQAAYLHDVLEDTDRTSANLAEFGFSPLVIQAVEFCMDEKGGNRKERKARTYEKVRQLQAQATENGGIYIGFQVKLADRMANLRACVRSGNTGLLQMYRKESDAFQQAYRIQLPVPDPYLMLLWKEYDTLMGGTT